MKTYLLLSTLISLLILQSGCKSPDTVAYKSLATTEAVVTATMKGWGDYVRANSGKEWLPAQETLVKDIYNRYRSTVDLIYVTRINSKTTITSTDTAAMQEIADQLIFTIKTFKGDK